MNIRKFVHALAALVMAATASLVLPQPAQAAPDGPCSVEEWKYPSNAANCASRLGQATTAAASCITAPAPGSPTSGMAGWFALRPDSSLRDGVQGQYSIYGVAGYGLDTYDLGCLTTIKHPDLQMWSTAANAEFMSAAALVGASNWLREHAYDPGSVWGWSDGFVAQTTDAIYKYVFNVFGALTLLGVGLYLIWRARHGHMSEAMKISGWALVVMVVTILIASSPERAVHGADSVANSGLRVVHTVLGPAPQDIPADQCVLGGEACKDNRSVATRASDTVTYAILYRTWLTAVLGDANSEVAKKYGPALFDATTMQWGEAARVDGKPALRQQLLQDKAATFKTIAEQIKTEDPVAYEYLQGVHGMDRAGAGFIAFLSALAFVVFDNCASLVILFGFGIIRMVIPLVPLFATIGMFHPASGGLRRIGNAAAAAVFNIAVFGALAGIYLTAVVEIFNSPLPSFAQFVVIALIGGLAILATRPIRMMVSTATGRSRGEDSLVVRAFRGTKEIAANRGPAGAEVVTTTTTTTDGPVRPEVARAASSTSTTRTVATAIAPSVTSTATAVLDNPTVRAAVDTARAERPEGDTGRARLGRVTAAIVDATDTASPWTTDAPTSTPIDKAAPTPPAQPVHRPAPRRPRPHPPRDEKKD